MKFSTVHWVEDSILDDAFDDVCVAKYESFLVNDKSEYNVFELNELCSTVDCLLTTVSASTFESVSPPTLKLKPLSDSLKYAFLRLDESLPVIITSDLDHTKRTN